MLERLLGFTANCLRRKPRCNFRHAQQLIAGRTNVVGHACNEQGDRCFNRLEAVTLRPGAIGIAGTKDILHGLIDARTRKCVAGDNMREKRVSGLRQQYRTRGGIEHMKLLEAKTGIPGAKLTLPLPSIAQGVPPSHYREQVPGLLRS